MKNFNLIVLVAMLLFGCKTMDKSPTAVGSVELNKYAGLWYDIASFPMRFQKGCHCTSAEYTLMPDGYVKVLNRCRKGSYQGDWSSITGKASGVEGSNNTKLKVQFFWPFKGDYWIVKLDDDYQWAVVSAPKKNYLWILSRNRIMDDTIYNHLITTLAAEGYDTGKLIKTPQQCKE
ncbi:MAG: lipocalin family protein [Lentimicrobium sp.]|jgi:apolipoprotein D and lipocalin family protein|nr:lipocalin family protein [Lentimicrobium sp.]MDD2527404.1 lipocalin family protein [Lentimicrobiaceae bacterium]MDD4597596.1 lipocalin family protein [Lentimicrobiaceae bacterium]MDY0026210.1 lipocalin family protein [Lentimicrobium sp.]